MAVEHNEKISLEEFFALVEGDPEHSYELIDGRIYMMTGGSPDHAIIEANLSRILGNFLQKRPCVVYGSDAYIKVTEEDCVCPDLSVSCDRRDRNADKAICYPCLVAEVLSPGTKARDKGIKVELYQNVSSIQEILLIDTQVMRIQLYRREEDYWTMRSFAHDSVLELNSLSMPLSVREVYEKTSFDEHFQEET